MSQQFCLKWNNHMNNMMDVFKNLLSTEAMVDVTLACDGLSLKAHRVVLSACSPFFQSLFLENPCKHPIVILKDMKYTELKAIIEFMYHGEVNVAQEQLSALMKTAETLRVKGLAEVTNEKNQSGDESSHKSASRTDTPPPKRRKGRTRKKSFSDQSDDGVSEPPIKQSDSDIEELSSDMDHNTPYSTASTVPLQSRTNSLHKSRQMQQQQPVESFESEENYTIEAPKLLQQTLTTDDLPVRSGRSSVQSNEVLRRSQSSIGHSSSLVPVQSTPMSSNALDVTNQQPESPPDIKPELLDLDPPMSEPPMSPAAGPSHSADENSMMFMDQSNMSSMSGPSFQDESALVPTDSQPQDILIKSELSIKEEKKIVEASYVKYESSVEELEIIEEAKIKKEPRSFECSIKEESEISSDPPVLEPELLIVKNEVSEAPVFKIESRPLESFMRESENASESPDKEASESPDKEASESPDKEASESPVVEASETPVVEASGSTVVEASESTVVEATKLPSKSKRKPGRQSRRKTLRSCRVKKVPSALESDHLNESDESNDFMKEKEAQTERNKTEMQIRRSYEKKKLALNNIKKLHKKILVPDETRLKRTFHLPVRGKSRRCAYCSTASKPHRTKVTCKTCNVGLCFYNKHSCCFSLFHNA